jgi:hypothetical protein
MPAAYYIAAALRWSRTARSGEGEKGLLTIYWYHGHYIAARTQIVTDQKDILLGLFY